MSHKAPGRGTLIAGLAFVIFATVLIASSFLKVKLADWLSHVVVLIVVASGIHLLDRYVLWREVFSDMENALSETMRRRFPLLETAEQLGIEHIYESRNAELQNEVRRMIGNAQNRLWLLGISFSEEVVLRGLVDELQTRASELPEVRLLLLDALRSTGVFRSLLESPPEVREEIVEFDRRAGHADPLFSQRMYRDFDLACRILANCRELEGRVRFYAHTPICWMIVADDVMLYQPYSFGATGGPRGSTNLCMGNTMPVFQFQRGVDPGPFDTLISHFDRLWMTSDCDLLHIGARRHDQDRVIRDVFGSRSGWLRYVVSALSFQNRKDPRRSCEVLDPVTVTWVCEGSSVAASASIVDVSRGGLRLHFAGGLHPADGDQIVVTDLPRDTSRAAQFLIQHVVTACDGNFVVRWSGVSELPGEIGVAALLRPKDASARPPRRPSRKPS